MHPRALRILALLALAGATAGCGQKGPLYLPDRTRSSVPAQPAAPAAPAPAPAPATVTPPASPDAGH